MRLDGCSGNRSVVAGGRAARLMAAAPSANSWRGVRSNPRRIDKFPNAGGSRCHGAANLVDMGRYLRVCQLAALLALKLVSDKLSAISPIDLKVVWDA